MPRIFILVCLLALSGGFPLHAGETPEPITEISQYGVTWYFAEPVQAGQFVSGDWWVVGPVTVTAVDPAPEVIPYDGTADRDPLAGSIPPEGYWVNGSMIDPLPGSLGRGAGQAYDQRARNFNVNRLVSYPITIPPVSSLVSTISELPLDPTVIRPTLRGASVLTVVAEPPPEDAFRPGLVAGDKRIYRESEIRWEILPGLEPTENVPHIPRRHPRLVDEEWTPRYARPWLVHGDFWSGEEQLAPINNMEAYHQYIAIELMVGAVLLVTDYGDRSKLMRHYLQVCIDYAAVSRNRDGGIGIRGTYAWPIIFAGLMFGDDELRDIFINGQNSTNDYHTYRRRGYFWEDRPEEHPASSFVIPGETWTSYHQRTGKRAVFWNAQESIRPSETGWSGTSETYRYMHSVSMPGFTLAALAMGEVERLDAGHHSPGAYSAYADRWMSETRETLATYGLNPNHASAHYVGSTLGALRNSHGFIDEMWHEHRDSFELGTWGGFRIRKDETIDTRGPLGVLRIGMNPWLWSSGLDNWLVVNEDSWSEQGAWAWVLNPEPPEPVSPTTNQWHGYPLLANDNIDTGPFLGYLNVANSPWVWVWRMGAWAYLDPEYLSPNGAWIWFSDLRPR